jgi:hypothetical protein
MTLCGSFMAMPKRKRRRKNARGIKREMRCILVLVMMDLA